MTINREEMKERIAEMVRMLAVGEILTLMSGHLSYRIPGTDEVLIPGHGHLHGKTLLDMTGDDIVTIDLEGNLLEGNIQPPGEKFIHTCIYRMREDVGAVIHGHPDTSLAFAAAGVEIIPLHIRAIPFAPSVKILDYSGQIDTQETGMMVAEALADRCALMLRGHGIVVVGETPEETCANAFELERNAKIQLQASILGVPKAVTREQVLRKRPDGQPHKVSSAWNYYRQKYSKDDNFVKVVTPVKTGVQRFCNALKSLIPVPVPDSDPGFTGMTILGHFRLYESVKDDAEVNTHESFWR